MRVSRWIDGTVTVSVAAAPEKLHRFLSLIARAGLPVWDIRRGEGRLWFSLSAREAARQLYGLLDRLPETGRTVFCLRVFGALPFAGIGASMGKTESWARVVYFRARQTLREAYDEL